MALLVGSASFPTATVQANAISPSIVKPLAVSAPNPTDCANSSTQRKIRATVEDASGDGVRRRVSFVFTNDTPNTAGFFPTYYSTGLISEETGSVTGRSGGIDICGPNTPFWTLSSPPSDDSKLFAVVSSTDSNTTVFPGVTAKDPSTDLIWNEDLGITYGQFKSRTTPFDATISIDRDADLYGQIKASTRSGSVVDVSRALGYLYKSVTVSGTSYLKGLGPVTISDGYFGFGNLTSGSYQFQLRDNPCGAFLTVPCTDLYLAPKLVKFDVASDHSVTFPSNSGFTVVNAEPPVPGSIGTSVQMKAANLNGQVNSATTFDIESVEYVAATTETDNWPTAIITTTNPVTVSQYGGIDISGLSGDLARLNGPQWIANVIDDKSFSVWARLSDVPAPAVVVNGVSAKLLAQTSFSFSDCSPETVIGQYTDWKGTLAATIPSDVSCKLNISAPYRDPMSGATSFTVRMNENGTFTVNGGSPQDPYSQFQFNLSTANFVGRVIASNGTAVMNSWISRWKYSTALSYCNGCRGWDYQNPQAGSQTAGGGVFGFTFDNGTNDIYELNINPPFSGSNSYVTTKLVVRVTAASGVLTKFEKCDAVFDAQAGTCASWVEMTQSNGRFDLVIRGANISGRLLTPSGINATGYAYVSVNKLGPVTWSSPSGKGWTWSGGSQSKIDGTFGLSIESEGSYWITAGAPSGESFPSLSSYVKAVGSGSSIQFYSCSGYDESSGELTGCLSSAFNAASMVLQYPSPDLVGTVINADGTEQRFGYINVGVVGGGCATCVTQWLTGASIGSNGKFAITFPSAGQYLLQINPSPPPTDGGSVRTDFPVTVTTVSGTKTVTVNGDSDGDVRLTLNGATLTAVIRGGEVAARYAQVEVYESVNGSWQFKAWTQADSSGRVSMNLTEGKFRISPRPSDNLLGVYSASTVFAFIRANGASTTTYLTSTESCAVAEPASGCTQVPSTGGVYAIALGTPNISGYITTTFDAARQVSNGAPQESAQAVPIAWIEAQLFNTMTQNYEWTSLVANTWTNSSGAFALKLPEGRWRLMVHVPQSANTAGLAKKSFDFTVTSSSVTCDVAYQFCAKDAAPTAGRFDLHLASANVSGTVTANSVGVSAADVRVEKWNGNYWQWVNMHTQASQVAPIGKYGLNIEEVGAYKITAQIPHWKRNDGYSANSIYVYRDSTKVCSVASEDDIKATSACASGDTEQIVNANIALVGANIIGTVRDAQNRVVGNSWVNVARYNTSGNYWQWEQGAALNFLGQFNLTLKSTLGNSATTPERYRIEIYPPWNSTAFVKKTVFIWVGNFDVSNTQHEFVLCSEENFDNCTPSAYPRRAAGSTLNIEMGQGNIFGVVTGPAGELAQGPYINVEKWSIPSWSSSYMWNWTEMYAHANNDGSYRLDTQTECPSGCFLRLTANPASWSNTNNWTRNSKMIHVASDGRWSNATQASDYETPVSGNSYSSLTLNIQLRPANITGVLKNATRVVPNAWITLLKQQPEGWYRWIDGTSSNGNGTFGLSTEASGAGRYRLEVNPPWNSGYVRFTQDIVTTADTNNPDPFVLCADSTIPTADCSGSSADFTLEYPQPNTVIKVCRKDESGTNCAGNKAVMNSWVTIYNSDTGNWVTGSNTEVDGTVRFLLPNGSYRAEVMPPWNSLEGTRVEFTFVVDNRITVSPTVAAPILSVDSSKNPKHIVVKLGSPNVSGFVKYRPNTTAVPMPNAWVNVRRVSDGSYLPGASTNSLGKFELTLANGNYVLTAFPNWNLARRQQKDVAITVSGNTVTLTSGGAWDGVIDFDAVSPNVEFTLVDIGLTSRQVFVQKDDGGGYYTMLVTATEPVITANTGTSEIKLLLQDGTYKLTIQKSSGDFLNGESCRQSGSFTVSGGQLQSSTAIDAWKTGFDATNDALACKNS